MFFGKNVIQLAIQIKNGKYILSLNTESSWLKNLRMPLGLVCLKIIGTRKIKDIKPMDVQQAINAMEKDGMSNSAMQEALGRLRDVWNLRWAVS